MSLLHVDYVPLGLIDATTMSYSPHPKVELLKYVYDVRAWLTPSIEDLHGHTQPHCFKFTLNANGHAEMFYKNRSGDGWSKDGVLLLKVGLPHLCTQIRQSGLMRGDIGWKYVLDGCVALILG